MLTWKINLAKGYANLLYRKADDAFHANSIHHRNNNVDSMRLLVLIWEPHSTRRNSWCRYHTKFERKAPLHSSSSDTRHCAILLRVSCFSPATHLLFRPQLLPIRIHQQRCRALFFLVSHDYIFSIQNRYLDNHWKWMDTSGDRDAPMICNFGKSWQLLVSMHWWCECLLAASLFSNHVGYDIVCPSSAKFSYEHQINAGKLWQDAFLDLSCRRHANNSISNRINLHQSLFGRRSGNQLISWYTSRSKSDSSITIAIGYYRTWLRKRQVPFSFVSDVRVSSLSNGSRYLDISSSAFFCIQSAR